MPSEGPRGYLIVLFCVSALLYGCASVPPAPSSAAAAGNPDGDEYEGWLFRRLSGQEKKAAGQAPVQATPVSGQSAASVEPLGPLVPGPSSARGSSESGSSLELIPTPPDSPAGPPPTIPNPLPETGVSIKNIQAKADEEKGFDLADISPDKIYSKVKKAAGYGPNEKTARTTMEEGKNLFREKKYKEAAGKFAKAAARWPDSPLEEDALFLKSESEFFSDQYPEAHDTIGGLLKKYANTRHLDTVVAREFAIGRYWEQLYSAKPAMPVQPNFTDNTRPLFDAFGFAVQAYERVRVNDPNGPLADDALMALGNAYFRRGQFENAAYNYDLLRKEYPNSEHLEKANLLGLQAKMRVYQGSFYDGGPLTDAGKIADQTLRQFGSQLGEERERVARARAQIAEEKANRDFVIGKYYENRKCYGSARLYYRNIIKEYPHTQIAAQAKTRLDSISDKPDEPPSRLGWLIDTLDPKPTIR